MKHPVISRPSRAILVTAVAMTVVAAGLGAYFSNFHGLFSRVGASYYSGTINVPSAGRYLYRSGGDPYGSRICAKRPYRERLLRY